MAYNSFITLLAIILLHWSFNSWRQDFFFCMKEYVHCYTNSDSTGKQKKLLHTILPDFKNDIWFIQCLLVLERQIIKK